MKWKKEGALEEALEMLLQALHCTVPVEEGRDLKWWVYEREEIIIASNIASLYRRLGRLEEAGKWFDTVMFSLEQQRGKAGTDLRGYEILTAGAAVSSGAGLAIGTGSLGSEGRIQPDSGIQRQAQLFCVS